MRMTYDAEADAAYIYLVTTMAPGQVETQQHSISTPGERGEISLDYDVEGRLVGIEVLFAEAVLPPDVLAAAEHIG